MTLFLTTTTILVFVSLLFLSFLGHFSYVYKDKGLIPLDSATAEGYENQNHLLEDVQKKISDLKTEHEATTRWITTFEQQLNETAGGFNYDEQIKKALEDKLQHSLNKEQIQEYISNKWEGYISEKNKEIEKLLDHKRLELDVMEKKLGGEVESLKEDISNEFDRFETNLVEKSDKILSYFTGDKTRALESSIRIDRLVGVEKTLLDSNGQIEFYKDIKLSHGNKVPRRYKLETEKITSSDNVKWIIIPSRDELKGWMFLNPMLYSKHRDRGVFGKYVEDKLVTTSRCEDETSYDLESSFCIYPALLKRSPQGNKEWIVVETMKVYFFKNLVDYLRT